MHPRENTLMLPTLVVGHVASLLRLLTSLLLIIISALDYVMQHCESAIYSLESKTSSLDPQNAFQRGLDDLMTHIVRLLHNKPHCSLPEDLESDTYPGTNSEPYDDGDDDDFHTLHSYSDQQNDLILLGTGPEHVDHYGIAHLSFEKIAMANPHLIALEHKGIAKSYFDLDSTSDTLANSLMEHGLGVGDFVLVISKSSIEMVTALYGVLKSGAAFIPVDSSLPASRISHILETSNAKLALVEDSFDVSTIGKIKTLPITTSSNSRKPHPTIPKSAPAYAIFTSGSTGAPKGVTISHESLSAFINAIPNLLTASLGDRIAQFASISFDMAVSEIFCTLAKGGTLVLKDKDDPLSVLKDVEKVIATPTLLSKLDPDDYRNLKTIVTGGEAISRNEALKWAGRTHLINAYGPTEITVACCWGRLDYHELVSGVPISIGTAYSNSRLYLLDKDLKIIEWGEAGELFVGGVGVSLGYLNRPDLTAQRFLADPFSDVDGARMYRTGDVCRWTDLGELQFLGRTDDMVKINGYRVELEEVSAGILRCDGITGAVVIAKDGKLIAFVTPRDGIDIDRLRAGIAGVLPHYMCPTSIIALNEFPRTSSEKVDKKLLSQLYLNRTETVPVVVDTTSLNPKDTAMAVRRIWSTVLKCSESIITPTTSFFEIGGDSLSSLIVLKKLATISSKKLTMNALYKFQTLQSLANELDGKEAMDTVVKWKDEFNLGLPWISTNPKILQTPSKDASIILTGATGFLGVHMLCDLIMKTSSKVVCIAIRADSDNSAMARLVSCLQSFKLYSKAIQRAVEDDRIIAFHGNLGAERMGLEDYLFRHLQETAGSIYHAAAQTNHLHSYSALRKSNVTSLEWIIKLATHHSLKPIHYVSSIGVWELVQDNEMDGVSFGAEVLLSDLNPSATDGYVVSKWVGEMVLAKVAETGVPVNVYRPSYITAHSKHGIANPIGSIDLMMSASLKMGLFPNLKAQYVDLVPVDYCSISIVASSLHDRRHPHNQMCNVYHANNPNSVSWGRIHKKLASIHPDLRMVEVSEYMQALDDAPEGRLFKSVIKALLPADAASFQRAFESVEMQRVLGSNLQFLFRGCPKVSRELLGLYSSNSWNAE